MKNILSRAQVGDVQVPKNSEAGIEESPRCGGGVLGNQARRGRGQGEQINAAAHAGPSVSHWPSVFTSNPRSTERRSMHPLRGARVHCRNGDFGGRHSSSERWEGFEVARRYPSDGASRQFPRPKRQVYSQLYKLGCTRQALVGSGDFVVHSNPSAKPQETSRSLLQHHGGGLQLIGRVLLCNAARNSP